MVCQEYQGGTKTLFLTFFAYFFQIFCFFLQFSTLESWYVWFTLSFRVCYCMCVHLLPCECSISGSVRGVSGVQKPLFEPFLPISWDFCFFQLFKLESCYIWFIICLEYMDMSTVAALALAIRCSGLALAFTGTSEALVEFDAFYSFVLSAQKRHSTRLSHLHILNLLDKFKIRVCQGGIRGY